ncbi:hypothetical protein [Oceanibaculum pacificum]|nr:hypothetical protein [Oceanibaculum pacificum]
MPVMAGKKAGPKMVNADPEAGARHRRIAGAKSFAMPIAFAKTFE